MKRIIKIIFLVYFPLSIVGQSDCKNNIKNLLLECPALELTGGYGKGHVLHNSTKDLSSYLSKTDRDTLFHALLEIFTERDSLTDWNANILLYSNFGSIHKSKIRLRKSNINYWRKNFREEDIKLWLHFKENL